MAVRLVNIQEYTGYGFGDEPALVSARGVVEQPFHYWRGESGARYLHTVYSLVDCPQMDKANYIFVRRNADDSRTPLEIGQTTEDASSLNLAHLRCAGARLGANEVHIHVLAETNSGRADVEQDLRGGQFAGLALMVNASNANISIH